MDSSVTGVECHHEGGHRHTAKPPRHLGNLTPQDPVVTSYVGAAPTVIVSDAHRG